jgi:hypothetical protein
MNREEKKEYLNSQYGKNIQNNSQYLTNLEHQHLLILIQHGAFKMYCNTKICKWFIENSEGEIIAMYDNYFFTLDRSTEFEISDLLKNCVVQG